MVELNEVNDQATAEEEQPEPPNPDERSSIEDTVVATIVRTAAIAVSGVHDVGTTSLKKTVGERFGGADKNARGVDIVLGQKGAVVDIDLIVKHGYTIPVIITNVRSTVRTAVAQMCGLDAKVINISVTKIEMEDVDHVRRSLVN